MIAYRSAGLRLAEVWFDETADLPADIVRYNQAPRVPPGAAGTPSYTLVVDLARSEGELLARMSKETRYEIRRAQKEPIACQGLEEPGTELLERFRAAFDAFARERRLGPLDARAVRLLAAARQLEISRATFREVGEIFHSYVEVGGRARLLHSVSLPVASEDPELHRMKGRANRLLHWEDIRRFKARGMTTFDLGGWYDGTTDTKLLQINAFKESFGGRIEKNYNAEHLVTTRAKLAVIAARLIGRRR